MYSIQEQLMTTRDPRWIAAEFMALQRDMDSEGESSNGVALCVFM
jgi:hypothetical protein